VPFPLLAHQAPVLPLKLVRPRWFSGVALCAGSLAPDLEYLRRPVPGIGHSLLGQFVFCLPISIGLSWLVARFVGPALASSLPAASPRWRFEALSRIPGPFSSAGRLAVVVTSSLVGSSSHVLLDAFTHSGSWACRLLPILERRVHLLGARMDVAMALQLSLSLLGGLAAVPLLALLFVRRPGEPAPDSSSPSPRGPARTWLIAATAGSALAVAVVSRGMAREATLYFQLGHVYVWGYILFRALCAGFAGFTLAAVVMSLRLFSDRPRHPEAPSGPGAPPSTPPRPTPCSPPRDPPAVQAHAGRPPRSLSAEDGSSPPSTERRAATDPP
jgi:membrane-bound metal-dependent hydrolase YbcI (DUF457 family)